MLSHEIEHRYTWCGYKSIVEHYEDCFHKFGDSHQGVDWPNEEDAQKRYRVMLDAVLYDNKRDGSKSVSILDFGCGLGHLYQYIREHNIDVQYVGIDMSHEFVLFCKEKYLGVDFFEYDALTDDIDNLKDRYDYVVMNGVFTEKCDLQYEEMKEYFQRVVKVLFGIARRGIAFNVMSKDVDWERNDLFHLPLNELSSFLVKNLSRCYVIRNDYGLYEYTTYVYKT